MWHECWYAYQYLLSNNRGADVDKVAVELLSYYKEKLSVFYIRSRCVLLPHQHQLPSLFTIIIHQNYSTDWSRWWNKREVQTFTKLGNWDHNNNYKMNVWLWFMMPLWMELQTHRKCEEKSGSKWGHPTPCDHLKSVHVHVNTHRLWYLCIMKLFETHPARSLSLSNAQTHLSINLRVKISRAFQNS